MRQATTYAARVRPELFVAITGERVFFPVQEGTVVPGDGSVVAFVSYAINRQPVLIGKPNRLFWTTITAVHPDVVAQRTLMIGDQMDTDISFGVSNGLRATLLVGTGMNYTLADAATAPAARRPSHFANSLAALLDLRRS